jgi:phosphoglycolate phosphatase-like HAD superfamily hydrolase
MPKKPRIATVVTDLDNTLFDWMEMWTVSFTALLEALQARSGISRDVLIAEIRTIHQRYHTSEYAFLVKELPSLQLKHPGIDLTVEYADVITAYMDARSKTLQLYPGVAETLKGLKAAGVKIIGYTESQASYSSFRIRTLKLDGVLDVLFSPADHERPATEGKAVDDYALKLTGHEPTPPGEYKPNPHVLLEILKKSGAEKHSTIYVGDSDMKDIAMAQSAGVIDVYAKYGVPLKKPGYGLLREVSHWSEEDVVREKEISEQGTVTPTYVLNNAFGELFDLFDFTGNADPEAPLSREKRVGFAIDAWKKAVDVQQHFNDLCLRIRNLAITVLGAVFSVAGIILKDARESNLPGLVVLSGALLCGLFYFMDAGWYHRLLKGSVSTGRKLETFITDNGVPIDLGSSMKAASAIKLWRGGEMRSNDKLHAFWLVLIGITVSFAIALFNEADRAHDARIVKEKIAADSVAAAARKDSVPAAQHAGALPPTSSASSTPKTLASPGAKSGQ